jgi:hypothetical protein
MNIVVYSFPEKLKIIFSKQKRRTHSYGVLSYPALDISLAMYSKSITYYSLKRTSESQEKQRTIVQTRILTAVSSLTM